MATRIPLQKGRLLWHFMQGNRLLYAGSVLTVIVATIFGLAGPLVLRTTIDSIIGDTPVADTMNWLHPLIQSLGGKSVLVRNLWICSLALVLLAAGEAICLYLKGKWSAMASEATARRMRESLYDHLQHLSYEYHAKAEVGDLIQRCTSDVDTIRQFLAIQLVEVGRAVFMVTAVGLLMLSLDVKMTIVATAFVPFLLIFAVLFFLNVERNFEVADKAEANMSTVLQENLSGMRVVRAFARQVHEIEKFDRTNSEFRDRTYNVIRLFALYWLVASTLGMAQFGTVLVAGAYWASKGMLSIGTLVVFISYVEMLNWPVRQMGRILSDMGKAKVSLGRLLDILKHTLEHDEDQLTRVPIHGDLEFKGVSFEYEAGKPVLKDISFSVKQGQTVAILGPTGSGKTSLVHLLARLYDYQEGSITINGVDIKEIEKKWLRKHIGLVLQEPFLFSRTIKQNIGLAKVEVNDDEIFEAAHIASVHDVIMTFEDGYETAVGEKGVTLSGGQKQRVAIAQTLIKESPILIFDDSLSAVDTETDASIRQALRERNHATTFMISHRVTTLAQADIILVLDGGRLVQKGSHEELIQEDGLYRKIWTIQNELEDEFKLEKIA